MSRRTSKVRAAATTSSSSKSAARSRSTRKPRAGKRGKETRSSDTGDKGSIHDDSPSQKPSPTAVQSTLPSATPVYQDEGSLQPCATQHGTTEIEELISQPIHTDFTQNDQTERSERTPLIPHTAHAFSETTDGSPILKQADRSTSNRSGKRKVRKKGTISTRAFFPPHLIGAHMSQRRVRRVRTSVEEKQRTPTSDASASNKPEKSGKKGASSRENSRRSDSKRKKDRKSSKSKRRRRKHHATQAERDARFYARVEKYKNRKVEMDCSCPLTRCECCEKVLRRVGGCMQTTGRACWVVCLPPILPMILNKAAFWPPSREYYFFQEEKAGDSFKKVTLRKADKSSLNKQWLFGFEHKCYKRLDPKRTECFVIETRKQHYIACVMVRAPTAQPRFTLLYSHPNGSDLSDHMNGVPSVAEIAKFLDCDIVIFDYSGYGISSGQCNEKSLFADIEGVYQHLTNVRKIDPAKIVIYGYSIGTAAAVALLAETQPPVAGVILLAPIASMMRVLMWKRLCFNQPFKRRKPCVDKFRSIEKIPLVNVPVLVCHGKDDIVVPIMHGEAIYDKAPNKVPPLWIPDASHNNLENTKELWARVRHFLYNELPPSPPPIASSQPATPLLVTPLVTSSPIKPPTVVHL